VGFRIPHTPLLSLPTVLDPGALQLGKACGARSCKKSRFGTTSAIVHTHSHNVQVSWWANDSLVHASMKDKPEGNW
jgi:hypothetical protein